MTRGLRPWWPERLAEPGTLTSLIRLGAASPAKQPVKAYVEDIGDAAKPMQGQINRRDLKIVSSIGRKPNSLGHLMRG